jgi:hypothetical protein
VLRFLRAMPGSPGPAFRNVTRRAAFTVRDVCLLDASAGIARMGTDRRGARDAAVLGLFEQRCVRLSSPPKEGAAPVRHVRQRRQSGSGASFS